MKVLYARMEEMFDGAFAVFVALGKGEIAQHQGPLVADLFTESQADNLVKKINAKLEIDPQYWIFDKGDPYIELRNLEDEYFARMAGE